MGGRVGLLNDVGSVARGSAAARPVDHSLGMTPRPIRRSRTRPADVSPLRWKPSWVHLVRQVVSRQRLATQLVPPRNQTSPPSESRTNLRWDLTQASRCEGDELPRPNVTRSYPYPLSQVLPAPGSSRAVCQVPPRSSSPRRSNDYSPLWWRRPVR